jgi:hypothetical protein
VHGRPAWRREADAPAGIASPDSRPERPHSGHLWTNRNTFGTTDMSAAAVNRGQSLIVSGRMPERHLEI